MTTRLKKRSKSNLITGPRYLQPVEKPVTPASGGTSDKRPDGPKLSPILEDALIHRENNRKAYKARLERQKEQEAEYRRAHVEPKVPQPAPKYRKRKSTGLPGNTSRYDIPDELIQAAAEAESPSSSAARARSSRPAAEPGPGRTLKDHAEYLAKLANPPGYRPTAVMWYMLEPGF